MSLTRRTTLASLMALIGLPASAAIRTPAQTEGPYYPTEPMRFPDIDNDLVKIAGEVAEAGGEIVHLEGRVLSREGVPIPGARVEIWQCDVNGRYMHSRDRNTAQRDMAFQGFGHDVTDAEGRYVFRTIKPVSYPGRTPHIHVKVFAAGRELTSQFYIADHPENGRDGIYRRMSDDERAAVDMVFADRDGRVVAERDIVV